MSPENETHIKDVYIFYVEYVKPLYAAIEAENNTLPVELLFEIHAAFDPKHTSSYRPSGHNRQTVCVEHNHYNSSRDNLIH